MSAEFVDTNILVYAHDGGAGVRHNKASGLMKRLTEDGNGAVSTQVLAEFYNIATKRLGRKSEEAETAIADFVIWAIHRPTHDSLLHACRLQRRYKLSWWDALLVQSAIEMESRILWTEDLNDGQRYGAVTVRNPFR
jgi:predicted nucleic acid-binding protein